MGVERNGFTNWEDANENANVIKSMDFRYGAGLEPMKEKRDVLTDKEKMEGLELLEDLTVKLEGAKGSEKAKVSLRILNMITAKSAKDFRELKSQES